MDNKYINIYNNLINLTRNKKLYVDLINHDTFSDRLFFFLLHFAFLLKVYKEQCKANTLQEIFDYFFNQLETTFREEGYGDVTINTKMKKYVNLFYAIIKDIDKWENLDKSLQRKFFHKYLDLANNNDSTLNYFENYYNYLKNNTFNSLLKGVIKPNF
tara:strand:- start:305 stop:778 length:474 start_codon:yes stop_codon:yes gene_type:complete